MKYLLKRNLAKLAVAGFIGAFVAHAHAGPIILGGDDLTDHGFRIGGANFEGWLYIEKAVNNLLTSETRAGSHGIDIAALGSAANLTFTSSNAGGAIGSAANVLSKSIGFFDGAAAITSFFAALAAGTVNPAMIWIAGTGAANDLGTAEGAALTANAAAINSFGASGGGIMAHGSGADAYGWLSALLPGLTNVGGCSSTGATLTAAGQAAFPGLSNSDIDANAGPCHSNFQGNFGGLVTLGLDGNGLSYIIGGGAATVIQCGQQGQPPCSTQVPTQVPEPGVLPLLALAFLGMLSAMRRRVNYLRS